MPSNKTKDTMKYPHNCVSRRRNLPIFMFAVTKVTGSASNVVRHFDEYCLERLMCSTIFVVNWKTTIVGYRYPPTLKDARPETIAQVTWPEHSHVTGLRRFRLLTISAQCMPVRFMWGFLFCFVLFFHKQMNPKRAHTIINAVHIIKKKKKTTKKQSKETT